MIANNSEIQQNEMNAGAQEEINPKILILKLHY